MKRGLLVILVLVAGAIGWAAARFSSPAITLDDGSHFADSTPFAAAGLQTTPAISGKVPVLAEAAPTMPARTVTEFGLTHSRVTLGDRPGTLVVSTLSAGHLSPPVPQRDTGNASPLIVLNSAELVISEPRVIEMGGFHLANEPIEVSFSSSRNVNQVVLTVSMVFDPADLDQSGTVDTEDLRVLVSRMEQGDRGADLNADDVVNSGDLELLVGRMGGEIQPYAVYYH